jgi:Leucine-rich repeat (LRR) protein
MSKAKKVLDESREIQNPELDLADKAISSFEETPGLLNMTYITRLTLSHNKIKSVPPAIAHLTNLEILNLTNNHVEELPLSLSSMPKLRILNLSINRLYELPRGFGAFPVLEVLDLTYNNLNEETLPGNFFMMETLRALYLGDNEFKHLPPEIKNLKNLQIVSMDAK